MVVADTCTSYSPLLMDRRVLLATSVLERTASEVGGAAVQCTVCTASYTCYELSFKA